MIYFWFVIGAVVGSFLNVCIYRLPRSESIIFPPSHCPGCGKQIAPLDLIPIISYIFLRGKCRDCGGKISFRYPLVELLTAIFFSLAWWLAAGDLPAFFFKIIFISVSLIIFFADWEHQVVPDAASFPGIFFGVAYGGLKGLTNPGGASAGPFMAAVFGAIVGYGLLYLIGGFGKLIFKKEAMGEGDLFIAAFLGASLGWSDALLAIFLAYLLAAAVSVVLILTGRARLGQYIPFGPALTTGGIIVLFFGPKILGWYFNLML